MSAIPHLTLIKPYFSHKPFLLDEADASDGVPAAIQILGRDLEEEKILSIAQIVSDAIKEHQTKQA